MAKAKKNPVKQYTVIEKFTGYVNEKRFDHKKGEIISLTEYEYSIYARFVKEMK